MRSDEQILAKTSALLEALDEKWSKSERSKRKSKCDNPKGFTMKQFCKNQRSKSKKGERKNESILREIEEDEMRVLEDVLDDLNPANLPLNDLFSGKMRVVIPFPTTDPSTDLGKFAKFFDSQEYNVEWEKGMVSATREVSDTKDLVASLMGTPNEKRFKKFQMKIGKLFAKIADLDRKKKEIVKKDSEFQKNEDYKRIRKQILLYIPSPGIAGPAGYDLEDLATKFGQYWQQNAAYIKKNIDKIDSDKFSIIITRHPIDVLRMSDFDQITSCHSPASRSNAYQSYYKCAVAEAQGHGAVAYVIETEDLLAATNTSNITSAEQEIQEGEIFYDDKRAFVGDIRPISRARIRHVRYYDTDRPKRYDDGQDVGMPERRIYGSDIPGIIDTVTDWARNNQEEVIANMPKENDVIDLDKFVIFGGSYEDTSGATGRLQLMQKLLGADVEVEGSMKQNTDTEDSLDADLLGDVRASYQGQCEEIRDQFNNRMANTRVDFEVQDDGADGVYIQPYGYFTAEWDAEEWERLPGNNEPVVWYSAAAITDLYGDVLADFEEFTPVIGNRSGTIQLTLKVNFAHPEVYGNEYMAMPEEFEDACRNVDTVIDDRRDAFTAALSEYFKREGQMSGGKYMQLAMEIDQGDISSYEWDLDSDSYDYSESYETTASNSFYYYPEEFGVSLEVLKQITDSRDFRIELRRQLLEEPRSAENTEYYLQMDARTTTTGASIRFTTVFTINADEPNDMVQLFQELVEGAMDDEDNLNVIYRRVMAQAVKARLPASIQTNESVVKNWKDYLRT